MGKYSFANHYVAFRDNSKWQAVVVSSVKTPWNELKRPQFQNHAVTISQNANGDFITIEEAHFICAILNSPIAESFILNSSDSRSFKINPPIYIPQYDKYNSTHRELSKLSIKAHKYWNNEKIMKKIDMKLSELVLKLKDISCEIKFIYSDSTTYTRALQPFGREGFSSGMFSTPYNSCRVIFNAYGKTISAKFQNQNPLVQNQDR